MKKVLNYIKPILIPVILGGIIGIITSQFIDYNSLNKPPFSPPSVIFPIIWTIIYILMGISYSILKNKDLIDKEINTTYYTQLFTNLTWPIIFFVFKWRFISIIWILVLLALVGYMIIIFYRKNKISSLLQIPYLLWTVFATYLTIGVYILNK